LNALQLLITFYKETARKGEIMISVSSGPFISLIIVVIALNFPVGAREYTPLMVASLENHTNVVDWLAKVCIHCIFESEMKLISYADTQCNGVEINQKNGQGLKHTTYQVTIRLIEKRTS